MMGTGEVVALTRELMALDTVDGSESAAQAVLAPLLEEAGFAVHSHEHAPGRATVVAEWRAAERELPPLCLSGHVDTVPLGAAPWQHDPYAGELDGDRLYGRGSSDMKGGVAAIVLAATAYARAAGHGGRAGLRLVLTAAEETGAWGARHVAPYLSSAGRSGPLLIAEPTANEVVHGHKGALWLQARTAGVTAHGSMPHLGENAVYKLARAVTRLEEYAFARAPHEVMGAPTLNVGTFEAGLNPNSVPDRAVASVDVRTVAGQDHAEVGAALARRVGPEVEWSPLLDLPPVWTSPDDGWVRSVAEVVRGVNPEASDVPRAATFFTDAAVLTPALGTVPTVICGPGEPGLAHATDEWCSVGRLEAAVEIYSGVIRGWCGG